MDCYDATPTRSYLNVKLENNPVFRSRSPRTFESAFLNFCNGNSPEKVLGPMGLFNPSHVTNPHLAPARINPAHPALVPPKPLLNRPLPAGTTLIPPPHYSGPLAPKPPGDPVSSTPPMVRRNYGKLRTEEDGGKPSLHTTIEKLKEKLLQPDHSVAEPSSLDVNTTSSPVRTIHTFFLFI